MEIISLLLLLLLLLIETCIDLRNTAKNLKTTTHHLDYTSLIALTTHS